MASVQIIATVERIEVRAGSLAGFATDLVLRDIIAADGRPLPDGVRVGYTGKLRALALMPGDRVALAGECLDAYDSTHRRVGAGLGDVADFLASRPEAERRGVTLRLVRPSRVRRVCGEA